MVNSCDVPFFFIPFATICVANENYIKLKIFINPYSCDNVECEAIKMI